MKIGDSKQSGFSLIEVLVAMIIFAGAILVINNVWSGNFFRIKKSRMVHQATFLLKQKITEYEILYAGRPLTDIPEKESGSFGPPFKNMSWSMQSREFEMPNLASALGGGEEQNQFVGILVKTMTEYMKKSVKEVKVSISITGVGKRKKPLTYSASTLFIDYNQDVSIPGIAGGGDDEDEDDSGDDEDSGS